MIERRSDTELAVILDLEAEGGAPSAGYSRVVGPQLSGRFVLPRTVPMTLAAPEVTTRGGLPYPDEEKETKLDRTLDDEGRRQSDSPDRFAE